MSPTPTQVRVAKISSLSAVLVAVVGLGGAWLVNRKVETPAPPPVHLTVAVFDETTKSGVEDADTALTVAGVTQDARTDSTGRHMFEIGSALIGKVATVRVGKAGYVVRRIELAIPSGGDSKEIFLAHAPVQVAQVDPVVPVSNQPTSQPSETATTPPQPRTTRSNRVSVPQSDPGTIMKSTVAPSDAAQLEFETATETFRSGPRQSGVGRNFSDWYTLCARPLAAGSEIVNVSYRLEGDRQCGAWSECRLGESTPARACFEFRLQGHDEVFPPRPFESEGFLTVTYKKPKAPPA